MTSAKLLPILRDFVPECHHARFGGNWTINKGKTEGHNVPPAYILPKYPSLNRVKATQSKAIFQRSKEACEKASESISHNVVSKGSKQGSSQMLIDSGKNLPCRKSERQVKFRALDRGVKKNPIRSMCGKKKSDQEVVDGEFDRKSDSIID